MHGRIPRHPALAARTLRDGELKSLVAVCLVRHGLLTRKRKPVHHRGPHRLRPRSARLVDNRPRLVEVHTTQERFHRPDGRRAHRQGPEPHRGEAHRLDRAARILAAEAQRRAGVAQRATICSIRSGTDVQRVVAPPHALVLAVGGVEELLQVVAADGDEIGLSKNCAARRPGWASPASRRSRRFLGQDMAQRRSRSISRAGGRGLRELLELRDEGEHHRQRPPRRAADQRLQAASASRPACRAPPGSRASRAPGSARPAASCRAAPCPTRCRACGRPPLAPARRRAPAHRAPQAPRGAASCCGSGTAARCGTARHPSARRGQRRQVGHQPGVHLQRHHRPASASAGLSRIET
jgi:hypothetical protein